MRSGATSGDVWCANVNRGTKHVLGEWASTPEDAIRKVGDSITQKLRDQVREGNDKLKKLGEH